MDNQTTQQKMFILGLENATLKEVIDEIDRLRKENFELAAGQCLHPKGIIGDDHGHQHCPFKMGIPWIEALGGGN